MWAESGYTRENRGEGPPGTPAGPRPQLTRQGSSLAWATARPLKCGVSTERGANKPFFSVLSLSLRVSEDPPGSLRFKRGSSPHGFTQHRFSLRPPSGEPGGSVAGVPRRCHRGPGCCLLCPAALTRPGGGGCRRISTGGTPSQAGSAEGTGRVSGEESQFLPLCALASLTWKVRLCRP